MISTVTRKTSTRVSQPVVQPTHQEIFYPGRIVRWGGRIYRVEWCDGAKVGITAGQGPYQAYYQYLPGLSEWNKYVVPVNHIFLQAL